MSFCGCARESAERWRHREKRSSVIPDSARKSFSCCGVRAELCAAWSAELRIPQRRLKSLFFQIEHVEPVIDHAMSRHVLFNVILHVLLEFQRQFTQPQVAFSVVPGDNFRSRTLFGVLFNPCRDLLVCCARSDECAKIIVIDLGELQPALVERAIGMVLADPAYQVRPAFIHCARSQYIAGQRRARTAREVFPIPQIAGQQFHFFEVLIHKSLWFVGYCLSLLKNFPVPEKSLEPKERCAVSQRRSIWRSAFAFSVNAAARASWRNRSGAPLESNLRREPDSPVGAVFCRFSQWNLRVFASRRPQVPQAFEKLVSYFTLPALHEPFKVTQILFHPLRERRRIENGTDLQGHAGFALRTRLKTDHARHETVG